MPGQKKKKVVIVGGGAAGMSCAATLAQHPDDFEVTIIERNDVTGGQATSISIDKEKYGTDWMNNGVQGGSPIFKHTFNFFKKYGHEPQEVKLQVAFGKGSDGFWTNCFPSNLINQYSSDIRKFGKVLKLIKWTMPLLGLVPIRIMLRMFFFSKDFGDKMVYPLIALFLGTGNQTANVSCAILERLFDDPNMKLWDYDPETLLPNLPTMVTFPNLHNFYDDWRKDLESKGVDVRLKTEVAEITQRNRQGVILQTRPSSENKNGSSPYQTVKTETFDELVMCVLADDALKLLGKTASRKEKFVLGGASFYDDITITHADSTYFKKHYETEFDSNLCADPKSKAQEDQIAFAKGEQKGPDGEEKGFRPMYYTKSYKQDPKKIEMSFDCSNYQHQFRESSDSESSVEKQHVYQSIFLDKRSDEHWTIGEIDESKIIEKKWWHQMGHRWQHYVRVVPGMMFINGKNNTLFAGSWTLVNMHELACVSGIASAYRRKYQPCPYFPSQTTWSSPNHTDRIPVGAKYTKFDDFAENFFSKYLLLSHGMRFGKEEKNRKRQH